MMSRLTWNLVAAAEMFAGFFAAVLFVYFYSYSFMGNRKPGMAAA